MLRPARWFGVSLVVHLVVVISIFLLASNRVERATEVLTVALVSPAPINSSRSKVFQKSEFTGARLSFPGLLPESATSPAMPQTIQPQASRVQIARSPQDPVAAVGLPKVQPEITGTVSSSPRLEDANSALTSLGKIQQDNLVAASEEGPSSETTKQSYLKENFVYIRALIAQKLVYPVIARKMNWSGKVVVTFTITEDGNVTSIKVVESSGYQILDKSAMETVRNVAPFPKPPVSAEIKMPINFKILSH